ncbi:MAG: hypothetical protein ACODAD_09480 [Planctomycetota bacterium]
MLSIFSRKQRVQCHPFVRKICDMTAPNMPRVDEGRRERRYNRSIPVIVCPWENDELVTDRCVVAITKDISDQGLSVILRHALDGDQMIIGFWLPAADMEEPWYFRAKRTSACPLGCGFWQIGFELQEYMTQQYREKLAELQPAARQLLPPAKTGEEQVS